MAARFRFALVAVAVIGLAAGVAWLVLLRPVGVTVAVQEREVVVQVFGLGTVEARVVSRLGFELAGRVAELRADAGERVRAGQVLARLDSQEAEARLAQAEAGVNQADAAVRQADAAVARARASLRQRQQVSERRQELVRRGAVSSETAQDAQAALDIATADLAQATSALDVANANLQQARATVALETARLDKHVLCAPYDAVIVTRHRELGATANPGEPVFTLVDPTTLWALAHVDEASAGGIAVGQAADVRLRSLPRETYPARVARIDVESDRVTEERRVYVKCDQCPLTFFLGEQAEVLITVGRLDRATLVPRRAIALYRGLSGQVWTVENGRLALRNVTFGAQTLDGRVEILSGLPEGAAAVTSVVDTPRIGRSATVAQAGAP